MVEVDLVEVAVDLEALELDARLGPPVGAE
jgi:hypothetical protein